ncbi:hypothetical protein J4E83_009366 [Alternaria metachromatica]|uniref:uncharacterized protein n=1 Tax=Alternaria metachromatica TaxID=283354 RepID=UPI0020C41332|nr:uncharacterized protein J4E83_009366 [Alternaria metachromatica]KAI4607824.1 hypothetical protein J4E83_009366 [Alternaria metachromatica]
MATSLPTEARGTKRKGKDVDIEDIISSEAQKIKTFIRGGFHKTGLRTLSTPWWTSFVHKAYRIITPLDRHKLMYLDPTSNASVEAIPSDVCLAHVHLDIFKLAYDWNIKHLQEFAHNALVKALAGQPTLAQFKHMLVSTGIFTAKYCTPPASEDHLLNLVLMALGTYGAMVHDAWMREENRQEYVNLYIVAPYLAVYRDLATPGHSVVFAEWSKEVDAKRQKIEGSGSMQLS